MLFQANSNQNRTKRVAILMSHGRGFKPKIVTRYKEINIFLSDAIKMVEWKIPAPIPPKNDSYA